MDSTKLEHYKTALLKLSRREKEDFERIMQGLREIDAPGEHDHHPSESVDKEYAIEQTEEEIRLQISEALKRIEQGTFGLCADCGKKISQERLRAIPYTPYCIKCEMEHESA